MRVYVSGPLQGSTDLAAARQLYLSLADALSAAGHEPYVPHVHTDPETAGHLSARDVYDRDMRALLGCEAVVVHLGAPSTGAGAELAIADRAGKAIVGVRRPSEKVSRFAEGLLEHAGGPLLVLGDAPLQAPLAEALLRARAARTPGTAGGTRAVTAETGPAAGVLRAGPHIRAWASRAGAAGLRAAGIRRSRRRTA